MGVKVFSEALGREVEVPESPSRIVSLSPAITEILYMLGVWDRVVGVSVFDHKPPEAREKPKVGSYWKVNFKVLEDLRPDLVITTTGAQRRVLEELAERFTVFPVPLPVSLAGVADQVVQVGIVVGALEEAWRLERRLLEGFTGLRGSLEGVRLYYEVFLGGPVTAGGHTYISDALRLLGAETPFQGERVTWITEPPADRIREFDPDVIVYEPSPYAPLDVERVVRSFEDRGLGGLRAVRERRIVLLPPDSLAHYGPSLLEALKSLVREVRRVLGREG